MMLPIAILTPLLGACVLALWRGPSPAAAGRITLAWTLASIAATCLLRTAATPPAWSPSWIAEAGITLRFEADGIAWLFMLLTGLVSLVSTASSLLSGKGDRTRHALVLVLQSALLGVFTARHFIPWFLCWEMTLVPAWLLVRLGGGPGATRAALRFFLMTLGGSAFMLVGFLALQAATGTMDFDVLARMARDHQIGPAVATTFGATGGHDPLVWIALAVLLGLAVKIPVFPLHAWLPDAYAGAPTPVTMLLTGLLSKMGVHALLRVFLPVFPEVLPALAPMLTLLAVATVLLGALAALAQTDLKRMLAYSSVNHLGYCALAVAAAAASPHANRTDLSSALAGTILQAFNHGIIAAALFFGIGILEHRGRGRHGLHDFGGLRARTPVFCGLFGTAVFASLGLPGLSGFVGEFLIFNGVFALSPAAAAVSLIGLLLTAVFLLRMIRTVFSGPLQPELASWSDLGTAERGVFALVIALIVVPGVWPQVLLHFANPGIVQVLDLLSPLP